MAGETSVRCDRARQWASLKLDGELSELETLLLERHTSSCAACREWQAGIDRATALLREAPVEQPTRRFVQERAAGVPFPLRYRLAVAGVAAAAVLGSILGAALDRPAGPVQQPSPELSFLRNGADHARRPPPSLTRPTAPVPRRPARPPEGAV